MTNVTVTVSHEEPVMSHQAGWATPDKIQDRDGVWLLHLHSSSPEEVVHINTLLHGNKQTKCGMIKIFQCI